MTATKAANQTTAFTADKGESKDAIGLLKADPQAVSQPFGEFEKTRSIPGKKALVAETCTALSVHAQIEEEVLYSAVKAALKDKFDAKFALLSQYVKHPVKEEQNEMFQQAKATSLDMIDLGARLAARKADLLAPST